MINIFLKPVKFTPPPPQKNTDKHTIRPQKLGNYGEKKGNPLLCFRKVITLCVAARCRVNVDTVSSYSWGVVWMFPRLTRRLRRSDATIDINRK